MREEIPKTLGCKDCAEGKFKTYMLDDSGCAVGDDPKLPGHAAGDYHWHCCHNTEPLKDCPLCGPPPKMCECGGAEWAHQPGEECFHGDDECPENCTEFKWNGNPISWTGAEF